MELMVKVAAIAVVAALLGVMLREREGTTAMLLTLAACVVVVVLAAEMLAPVLNVAARLQELAGLASAVTAPLFKTAAIGLIAQIAAGVCADAGARGLEKAVELAGSLLAVYASLPLVSSVLDLLQDLLGG